MNRIFTVEQARRLLPTVQARAAELVAVRADLVELATALRDGPSPQGGIPEVKALEARLNEHADWFGSLGIEVKGLAPLLLDFPAQFDGEAVLLCWLEGEPELGWYHRRDHGFAGRRRIPPAMP
ncbi:MAG: DUF2203 domain-containing protein [Micromonosporaceae bacterium]